MTTSKPTRGKIIVFGILFFYPLAGVTFQFLHYLIGLRRLGYDVYYIEDTARWIYDPTVNDIIQDATRNVMSVAPVLEAYGFGDKWAYRGDRAGPTLGMGEEKMLRLFSEADAMLN